MAFFGLVDTKDLEVFSTNLADDLGRRFPPSSESRTDTGAKHQIEVILEGLAARAVRYQQERNFGLYRKAKLANVFKWRLTELGYSKAFVERATKSIATKIALR